MVCVCVCVGACVPVCVTFCVCVCYAWRRYLWLRHYSNRGHRRPLLKAVLSGTVDTTHLLYTLNPPGHC